MAVQGAFVIYTVSDSIYLTAPDFGANVLLEKGTVDQLSGDIVTVSPPSRASIRLDINTTTYQFGDQGTPFTLVGANAEEKFADWQARITRYYAFINTQGTATDSINRLVYDSGSNILTGFRDDTTITSTEIQAGATIPVDLNELNITSSGDLSQMCIQRWENNATLTDVVIDSNGDLTWIFGNPPPPTLDSLNIVGFNTDRFDMEEDTYQVDFTYSTGSYSLISASIASGSDVIVSTTSSVSMITASFTNAFQIVTYSGAISASNPSDQSIFSGSLMATAQVNKIAPGNPTAIFNDAGFQCGIVNNRWIHGDSGMIIYTSASGTPNRWIAGNVVNNNSSPIAVSNTDNSESVMLIQSFTPPAPNTNTPITNTFTRTFTSERPLRYGSDTMTTPTVAQIEDISLWTFQGRTINPNNQVIQVVIASGDRIHIIYDSSQPDLTSIFDIDNNSENITAFTLTTVGNYKVYTTNNTLAAGTLNYRLST